ncbi:ABC-2 transporter permease [Bacillus sp. Hm123]|uniref:ABC-2 transporter permease n=1 Tax=Bacillus sp. Hm123 TaxID=3450745 RepID=UPI003F4329D1
MFNLIRKDIILQKTTLMILLPILFMCSALASSSIWVGIVFSLSIIMTTFTIDEKSEINSLLNSLPYTRKEVVSSKYIGTFIFTFIVVFTIFTENLIIHREITAWKDIMFIVSVVMVSVSLMFPFSYQFKTRYLHIGGLVLVGICMVVINTLIPNWLDIIRENVQILLSIQNVNVYLLIMFSIIILYVCSWLLSIRIYNKKVF